jgi:hypothetical protein
VKKTKNGTGKRASRREGSVWPGGGPPGRGGGPVEAQGGSNTGDRRQPGHVPGRLRPPLEERGSDPVDPPSVFERRPDLLLRDPAGPVFAGFELTEGEHEAGPSRPQDSGETPDEAQAIGVGEGVEQAGVDDGIEGPAEVLHIEGVLHQERDGKIALPRLFPGKLDRPRHRIHSPDLVTALSEKEGILPGPAPDVQDVAADFPRLLESHELPLWSPDLPVRDSAIRLIEYTHTGGKLPFRDDELLPVLDMA